MTAVARTKDYFRATAGIGLIWSLYTTASLPSIPFLQIATILLMALFISGGVTLGYRWLTKKIADLQSFPIF